VTSPPARPARLARPAVVMAALAGAFFLVARSTGSGWVTVLLCGVVGCLTAGTMWPAWGVGRAAITVTVPRDGTVGQPLAVDVVAARGSGLRVRLLEPASEWFTADAPAAGEVVAVPERRGVLQQVTAEVTGAAPLGLCWWRRRMTLPLSRPLEVGPRRCEVALDELAGGGASGPADALLGRAGHDTVRSVRPYAPGDAVRLVHWPATARWGEVMVKELEKAEVPTLVIVVDLRPGGDAAEVAASRAAGVAEAALSRGVRVSMLTAERGRAAAGEVASALEVGRRLARAVAAAPPDGPIPAGGVVVRVSP
jgi:uncharacterized protein (DUF58 family)